MRAIIALAVLVALATAWPARSEEPEPAFRVIVHPSNPVTSVSREQLARFFLKRSTTWEGGATVVPVDQPDTSAVREQFSRQVLGKTITAVRAYWQQKIFSGKDVPPTERSGDAEVMAFVRGNPNAVGYVSAREPVSGVKVITLRDE